MKNSLFVINKRWHVDNARFAPLHRWFAGIVICFLSTWSHAEGFLLDRWWIQTGGVTHHISSESDRNGDNYGLGLEYKYSATQSVRAGYFKNSYGRNAPYVSYVWLPWKWGIIRVGANAAVAGGYNNRTNALAAIIPWSEITWKYVGIELGVVPVRNGIVTLQFKFRLD